MEKFQRNYKLEVDGWDPGTSYTFEYPLTMEFSVNRAILKSPNNATIRLFNLNQDTRKAIYKDNFENYEKPGKTKDTFRHVRLMAGYGDTLTEILNGNLLEAKSYREEGQTHFITELQCHDWSHAMMNAMSNFTLGPPVTKEPLKRSELVTRLISDLVDQSPPNNKLSVGFVSDFDTFGTYPYTRPFSAHNENTWDLLSNVTFDHNFIDNGVLHCLSDNDCYDGDTKVIEAETGLLSTPKKSDTRMNINILFEPSFKLGQSVEVISESETWYNGKYKIIGIQHSGIISGAVGGKCRTTLILNAGQFILRILGEARRNPAKLGKGF